MNVLFIFLDGVGLGEDNPSINPFARADMPQMASILGGHKITADGYHPTEIPALRLFDTGRASLLALDACLGVEGIPQSATGQASLVTGINVPKRIGYHEGPKPTPPIIEIIKFGTLFTELQKKGRSVSLVNAYPPRYFESIDGGYRLPGVFAMSARQAGVHLKTKDDLYMGDAISVDFTGEGWRSQLGFQDTPLLTPCEAGERLNELARQTNLTIFEYWLSDVAGHHRDMETAQRLLNLLDTVLGSLFSCWKDDEGVIIVTSDHGNLEDLSTRRHTLNEVPLLIVGSVKLREKFIQKMSQRRAERSKFDLTDLAPAILDFID